jgi:uncharacterized protein YndB with AHSA1/START domain
MMSALAPTAESLTFTLTQEIHVRASLQHAFEALLEQMGPANETHDHTPMPMKIEPWPGGRWFRDLGNDDGHLWGHVQAIKKHTLLEISGPLFMSSAVFSNLQYRLKEVDGGTLITLRHAALGFIPDEYKAGLKEGWTLVLDRAKKHAEAQSGGRS